MSLVDLPEEDSPDMTLDELAGAIDAPTSAVMVEHLSLPRVCPVCQGPVRTRKHLLRRRAPHYYARVFFLCQDGHESTVTFRALFLETPDGL